MHKTTNKNVSLGIALTSLLISLITYGGAAQKATPPLVAEAQEPVVTVTATPKPTEKPIPTDIKGYIEYKFGDDSWKAFKILQGDECHENLYLDQNAFNRNWVKDQPGVYWSTDWGVFQINDKFHPVEELNLRTDWKANIDYAYRMFLRDNRTFARWTCGRYYGL